MSSILSDIAAAFHGNCCDNKDCDDKCGTGQINGKLAIWVILGIAFLCCFCGNGFGGNNFNPCCRPRRCGGGLGGLGGGKGGAGLLALLFLAALLPGNGIGGIGGIGAGNPGNVNTNVINIEPFGEECEEDCCDDHCRC